jgi:NADP-dependent 3-hydroxy acid dehydrogenase YdfG
MRKEALEESNRRFQGVEPLNAQDIADTITYVVTRPRDVAINEILVRPTEQEG